MQHVKDWPITLHLYEEDGRTNARVRLDTGARSMRGEGDARCRPTDFDIPEIGDELAAGRALIHLGNQLLRTGAADIEEIEGRPVYVAP